MVNYKNSKIYKITSSSTNECFINSTTKQYLSQRMTYYKFQYQNYKVGKNNFKNKEIIDLGSQFLGNPLLLKNSYIIVIIELCGVP